MKLDDLDIFVVGNPAPGWGGRYFVFVQLTTACGITGVGEVYATAVGTEAMRAVIVDVFTRHMAGENPENIEMMFRRAYSSGFTQRPDPTVMGAFSGLEIACWDILGKAHDRPVHALTGGMMQERLRAYTYLYPLAHHDPVAFWSSPDMAAESAVAMVAQGYTAVKFDPAGPYTIRGGHQPAMRDISLSVAMCKAVREAVGDRADILFGTHGQFSTGGALRLAQAIEPYQPLWFEEPVPPDNTGSLARVSGGTRIPVAVGERLCTKGEFAQAVKQGGANILQPALGRAGGIGECRKIAAIAEVYNAQIAPHLYAGPVEWAANIQYGASLPNLLMVESIGADTDFHAALIGDKIAVEDGFVPVPVEPGLGIAFDAALARANPYRGDKLHLEMQEAGCAYGEANGFAGGAVD